ncbi:hypothetical protein BH23BAC2_BH23BAC2_27760 [soil metagenome]
MLAPTIDFQNIHPSVRFGKDRKGVDKGTSRETPGSNEGARPPKKEEYNEKDEPETEEVDNEQKDRMKQSRKTRLDENEND